MFFFFWILPQFFIYFFFFNATAPTEIYTLSLHDALPISGLHRARGPEGRELRAVRRRQDRRSEEHTSELQSRLHLVCRLLLEKKKHKKTPIIIKQKKNTNKKKY